MITQIKIANFRIFNEEVSVRFRPITVLIGKNSAGKSSIVKFLLMLQQSLDAGRSEFLTTDGDKVNLGILTRLKNSISRKRTLSFALTAESVAGQPDESLSPYFKYLNRDFDGKLIYTTGATIRYSSRGAIGRSNYRVQEKQSGEIFFNITRPVLEDSVLWELPRIPESVSSSPSQFGDNADIEETALNRKLQEIEFIQWLAEYGMLNRMRHEIVSMRNLLPVRDDAQQTVIARSRPLDSVGDRGQFALQHLQAMVEANYEQYEFILPHLRQIADIEDVNFVRSRFYSEPIGENRITGAKVLISHFGFGVSQCLPVLIQGAIMAPFTSLMVEQPEAQLHPTAQLALGSYFADLWNNRRVRTIIETHSDNILLRLRRLIANGELSHEDVSVAFFTFDEQNGNMPIIKNLDINEDGSMQAGLPMEFFGADIIESLNLGVGM